MVNPLYILQVCIYEGLAVGFTIAVEGKWTYCDYLFRYHIVRKMLFQIFLQALFQILFTLDKKKNEMKARFVSVHCSNHLFVPTEYTSMEFDFFKLYPVAVNFYLVVYPPQIQKITSLVDFT